MDSGLVFTHSHYISKDKIVTFTPIQNPSVSWLVFLSLLALNTQTKTHLLYPHTPLKPLIYRQKQKKTSFLLQTGRKCVYSGVWDDIFRFQGQGVFPLLLSIVPAATVILGEQSNHQDRRAAANGRAGRRGPQGWWELKSVLFCFAVSMEIWSTTYPLRLHEKDCDHGGQTVLRFLFDWSELS